MASGLHIESEETIVRSVVIHGFRGDGILYEGSAGPPLTLVDVWSSRNCGSGLRIPNNPLGVQGVLTTTGNGTGEGCEAGELLVQGSITDASDGLVDTSGNNCPGLVAHDDISISLFDFESIGNKGPGIQTLFGCITITPPDEGSSSLNVRRNEGPGMLAGLDLDFGVANNDDPSDEPMVQDIVVLGVPINVESNGSRGILASGQGDVCLNVNPDTELPMSLAEINVSGNGGPDDGCCIYTD